MRELNQSYRSFFVDEKTGDRLEEMCLAELIQQPGYKIETPRLTMDFSKPVVQDRLKTSVTGGNPDKQVIIYRFVKYGSAMTDTSMETFIKQKWQSMQIKEAGSPLSTITSVLLKFRKLLELMSAYPNRRDNVLKQIQVSELPLAAEPIGLLAGEVAEKII